MTCKTFHRGKYYVSFKRGFEDYKKDIIVTVDKVFESDSLKISLSDEDDPTFLCVLCITRMDYDELKKQQGLLIDFDNFPSQLVRLLQQCASNNMFLIMQQTNPIQYYFEVVEHNEFKRLVHLSLKTAPATDADIKLHMAENVINLKKTLATLKSSGSSSEALWNDKCMNLERKVHDLSHVITKMEEDKLRNETEYQESMKLERERLAQERLQWQNNADLNLKTQLTTYQENMSRKEKQYEECNTLCKQLRESIHHLENQMSEKSQRVNLLEAEVQKTHIEVATLKAKNVSLERDIAEKEKLYNQQNTRCVYLEKVIKENSDTIKELNNSLQKIKTEKTSLEERLTLSESLMNRNNEAIHSTSEQLLKANQIISKQNADLIEMKDKLLCRTAIALEQEKIIESSNKEMESLKSQMIITNQNMEKLKQEFAELKEKYDSNENALKDRDETIKNNNMVIQWLHKKMEDNCVPNDMLPSKHKLISSATSSTPYFLPKNNHSSSTQPLSDDSIDFYATSKLSISKEESPGQGSKDSANRVGLDPKYLKPVPSDSQVITSKGAIQKAGECQNRKGKENINIDLPKVDYREKKSSRPTSYRVTPVSAYFP